MRRALLLIALAGCFEEGGDTRREDAANVIADSLLSFADIQANLTTNPSAAGEALTRFVKLPVAAGTLLEQPFDASRVDAIARAAPVLPGGIPSCLTTSGTTGCDGFATNAGDSCVAGNFAFTGTGSRTCGGCELDPPTPDLASCDYNWNLDLSFTTSDFSLTMTTVGSASIDTSGATADVSFGPYRLTSGSYTPVGSVRVCVCGTLQFTEGQRLIDSSFVVKDFTGARCARVEFDGDGHPTARADVPLACTCSDGITCAD